MMMKLFYWYDYLFLCKNNDFVRLIATILMHHAFLYNDFGFCSLTEVMINLDLLVRLALLFILS